MAKQQSNIVGNVLKGILVLLLLVGFFEVGLLSSYTIVTSQAPDVRGLIDLQLESISSIFSSDNINEILIKDPGVSNISNADEVADYLTNITKIDGVNVKNMNATSYQSFSDDNIDVEIEALGYASVNVTSGQIVLSENPDYKIIASAKANPSYTGVKIDISTIKIVSVIKLYNNNV